MKIGNIYEVVGGELDDILKSVNELINFGLLIRNMADIYEEININSIVSLNKDFKNEELDTKKFGDINDNTNYNIEYEIPENCKIDKTSKRGIKNINKIRNCIYRQISCC